MAKEPIWLREAVEAERIAQELIAQHYPKLAEARLLWLETNGKAKCTPRVLNPFERYLSSGTAGAVADGYDLVCVLNTDEWAYHTARGSECAVLDHLLAHIVRGADADGNVVWTVRPHEVEEFTVVLQRHGPWHARLQEFGRIVQQLRLPEEPGAAAAAAAGIVGEVVADAVGAGR
jgi:hypothetical protein